MAIPHAQVGSGAAAGPLVRDHPRSLVLVVLVALLGAALVGPGGRAQADVQLHAGETSRSDLRGSVVDQTNKVRARAGCAPLRPHRDLTRAAQLHANDLSRSGRLSHRSSDGQSWSARIREQGYPRPAAENTAAGYVRPADVMRAWLKSPIHRPNLVNCRIKRIGIGFNADGGYWVQDFGF
ncbi:MAG: CAP domain-containing protein [Sporichthyaceae bacterium]